MKSNIFFDRCGSEVEMIRCSFLFCFDTSFSITIMSLDQKIETKSFALAEIKQGRELCHRAIRLGFVFFV